MQETRDTPTLTVLDPARSPEIKAWPKRGLIVIVSTLVALVLSAGWVGLSLRRPEPA